MKILIVDDSFGWLRQHTLYVNYAIEDAEIYTASSAKEGDMKISENIDEPFDVIFTDMQMEADFLPLNAGEWLIKQIQFYPEYKNTKIVVISARTDIAKIAEKYGIDYIPKRSCEDIENYKRVLLG